MRKIKDLEYQKPINALILYLVISLVIFAIGPFNWKINKPLLFWTLQVCFLIALFWGWQFGLKLRVYHHTWDDSPSQRHIKLLSNLLVVYFLILLVNVFRVFGFSNFNIGILFQRIMLGLGNMGGSYHELQGRDSLTGAQVFGGYFFSLINYIWGLVSFSVLLFGLLYFKKLNRKGRIFAALSAALTIIQYMSVGTNIGVFRIVLALLVFSFFKNSGNEEKKKPSNKVKALVGIVVATVLLSVLFNTIMTSRGGINYWQSQYYSVGGYHVNRDSVLFKFVPKSMYKFLVSASAYLCQGYQGMALTLNLKWIPMFGIGNSRFLLQLLSGNSISGRSDSLWNMTYQRRIETQFGWDEEVQWHSLYSWLANDVSYIGVIVVMFIIGALFAMCYRSAKEDRNPYAIIMCYLFVLMCFFIPCNNQIAQTEDTLCCFYLTLVCWLVSRKRRVRIKI